MPVGNLAAAVGLEKEYVSPKYELLAMSEAKLWGRMKINTKVKPVSNRPFRIPMQPLTAGKFRVAGLDGQDLGLGSGPQLVPATSSCVSFVQASQWTALAEYTTDSDAKAIEDYVAILESQQIKTMAAYMDALLQTDGSNTLDTVVAVAGQVVTVNNPNIFQDNQDIDFYSNLLDQGGAFLGTATILSVDAINVQVTFTGALPAGVGAGTRMLVSGSAGVSNSGINGLRAMNVAGNTGTYLNIQKSAYPGKFSVPNFNAPGTITPSLVRAIEGLIEISMGLDEAEAADLTPHCNIDMAAAWENNAIQVQGDWNFAGRGGDTSADMLKKRRMRTIGGREIILNTKAKPGYIDWLALEYWQQYQSKALAPYDVKGQTVFPTRGASGGIATGMLMYLVIMMQTASVQPRLNAYLSGVNIPKYYLGH